MRTIQARERGLDLQASSQDISRGTLKVQEEQVKQQREELEERKKPKQPTAQDVEGAPGYKVIDMGGGKRQLVAPADEDEDIPVPGQLKPAQISQVLTELQKLKDSGESHATVSKDGIVRGSRYFTNDDPIDELMQKYRLMSNPGKIRRDAQSAIDQGADPEAVKKAVKERYGIDL